MVLIEGEGVNFRQSPPETSQLTDEQIGEKYVRGEVRIVTEQARYPLTNIVPMFESPNYLLTPEFQRRKRWNNTKKSRLIESFIMNVPVPPIFLYEDQYSHYEVMDGLQRISTIMEFYTDKFALENLEEWPELNGRRYSQLPDQVQRGIDRRYLSSIILLQETAKDLAKAQQMKQLVFERINSGGVKLESQETRNALYDGPLNKLCIKLAKNPQFCMMWGMSNIVEDLFSDDNGDSNQPSDIYSTMGDVELVLRFFAFRQIANYEKTSLTKFLDTFLIAGNQFSDEILIRYEKIFNETIQLIYDLFGDTAFRLWRQRSGGQWNWFDRPTKVVYDTFMYVFCERLERQEYIREQRDIIVTQLPTFYETNYEKFGGRDRNRNNIVERMELFGAYIDSFLR